MHVFHLFKCVAEGCHMYVYKNVYFLESILEFKRFQHKKVDTQQIKILNEFKIQRTRK